jgi:2-methylcitrate dehydratase PrpD
MSSNGKNTAIEALSANVLETRFENFDQATIENTRYRIIDVLGCGIGGANAAGNAALVKLVKDWGGKKEASILVHGGKVPAHNAAMVNSIMARSFDFEALVPQIDGADIPAHISGTTVMTAITLGEMMDINGKELITALLAGDDAAIRVLAAAGFWLDDGWDDTGTINAIGATAIAGRLLGLNERQMRHAFGIVLSQLAGTIQNVWDGCTTFKLPQGLSARNGIFSAQLAKAGWTGPGDLLLSKYGYYALYTGGCNHPEILTKDLGKKYYTELTFKPYPSCRGTHPPIDCAVAITHKHNIKADDIEAVTLYLCQKGLDIFMSQPFRIGEFPHGSAAFNCQYTVACGLLRGDVKPRHFSEEAIRDPQLNALISKIRLAELPGAPFLSAKLEVKMKDGRVFSEFTDTPRGDPQKNPLSKDEIKDKYRANVDFSKTVSQDNAEKVLELLANLEELDSVNKIVKLLVV